MRNVLVICGILLLTTKVSSAQDSVYLFFREESLLLSKGDNRTDLPVKDAAFHETLFEIGGNKYLYMKRSIKDSLPVELGQLGLYQVNNKLFLLREGRWITAERDDKVLFENSGEESELVQEVPVSITGGELNSDDDKKQKKGKRLRRAEIK